MTLITIMNIIGCIGVIAAVVAPLAYAIRTQHRNEPQTVGARVTVKPPRQPRPARDLRAPRRDPRPAYEAS